MAALGGEVGLSPSEGALTNVLFEYHSTAYLNVVQLSLRCHVLFVCSCWGKCPRSHEKQAGGEALLPGKYSSSDEAIKWGEGEATFAAWLGEGWECWDENARKRELCE